MLSRISGVLWSVSGSEAARNAATTAQMEREDELEARITAAR